MKSKNRESSNLDEAKGLVYPCDFPLKMFGKKNSHFMKKVDSVVERIVPRKDWSSTKTTLSKDGNYISYTIVIVARNREQLDNVCAAVTDCPGVIIAM